MALHPHGDVNRYRHGGCHCTPCRAAHAAAARQRRREIAYGWRRPDTDAAPVRAHVQELRRAGMTIRAVASAADVKVGVVNALLYGRPSQGEPPSRKLRAVNADKLMAVRAEAWAVAS